MKKFLILLLVLIPLLAFSAPPAAEGPYDQITGAMMVIDYAHHEVHSGSHFSYTYSAELGSAATQSFLLETMAAASTTKQVHLTLDADGSAITQFELYEATDRIALATASLFFNSNRAASTVSTGTLLVYVGVASGTTDGNLIWSYKGGSAQGASRTPAAADRSNEFVLRPGTKYLFKVTSGTAANLTNVSLHWYEHTPKE